MLTMLVVLALVIGGMLWLKGAKPALWAAWVAKVKAWFTTNPPAA